MKKFIISFLLLFCFLSGWAQRTADFGIRIGAATYWGDIENVDYKQSVTPLYGVLGRWNFNNRMSIRGQLVTGDLKASGTFSNAYLADQSTRIESLLSDRTDYPFLYPKQANNTYYFKRNIQTFEAIFEFNFKEYKMGNLKDERFTPFVSLGLGVFYSRAPGRSGTLILEPISTKPDPNNPLALPIIIGNLTSSKALYSPYVGDISNGFSSSNNQTNNNDALSPIIPIGFGFKYNLTKRLGVCMELCVRKTFTDNIDNLVDPKRFQDIKLSDFIKVGYPTEFAPGPLFKNDWYASLHLSLHWQVWSDRGICKVVEKNQKMMMKNGF